jgi:hypothetical protein
MIVTNLAESEQLNKQSIKQEDGGKTAYVNTDSSITSGNETNGLIFLNL